MKPKGLGMFVAGFLAVFSFAALFLLVLWAETEPESSWMNVPFDPCYGVDECR